MSAVRAMNPKNTAPRWQPYLLLALANLFWAGNWVVGRALRDAFGPVTLNFSRWAIAAVVLLPFALPQLAGKGALLRRNAGLLAALVITGVVLFQSLVYLGLRSTTAVNAVLLNCTLPLFMLVCSWVLERERATMGQVAGMLISFAGVAVILVRGELGDLLRLRFYPGDALILLAMPMWGIYSVLLKRWPRELWGTGFMLVLALAGMPPLLLGAAFEVAGAAPIHATPAALAGVLYVGLFASVGAFICWNRGVVAVGANAAGFSLPLLPAFGTVLAIVFLGEQLRPFHWVGFGTILLGVFVATRPGARRS
ncbi:MAG TPA: DMT family transporter [Burkholderiales bacterium]|nr:DMT family transporter [Burkholderiales bacterium]